MGVRRKVRRAPRRPAGRRACARRMCVLRRSGRPYFFPRVENVLYQPVFSLVRAIIVRDLSSDYL